MNKWKEEFNALPEWTQKLVRAASSAIGYGGESPQHVLYSSDTKFQRFFADFEGESGREWWDGWWKLKELSDAITAPDTPDLSSIERSSVNLVEVVAGGEDCAFDQPCAFGHRVEFHAVYCHNGAWPNSPRKCRRNRDDYLHEDCPGFAANPRLPEGKTDDRSL